MTWTPFGGRIPGYFVRYIHHLLLHGVQAQHLHGLVQILADPTECILLIIYIEFLWKQWHFKKRKSTFGYMVASLRPVSKDLEKLFMLTWIYFLALIILLHIKHHMLLPERSLSTWKVTFYLKGHYLTERSLFTWKVTFYQKVTFYLKGHYLPERSLST